MPHEFFRTQLSPTLEQLSKTFRPTRTTSSATYQVGKTSTEVKKSGVVSSASFLADNWIWILAFLIGLLIILWIWARGRKKRMI